MPGSAPALDSNDSDLSAPLPRWPVLVATLAVGGIYTTLPPHLRVPVGPGWALAAFVAVLSLLASITHRNGRYKLNQLIGYGLAGTETLALLISVVNLVLSLPTHKTLPVELLRDAGVLYISNILVFAIWYWRLDAGGPHMRDARPGHRTGAFLFPQMTLAPDDPNTDPNWTPDFIDYLFLAFNTSTALSPTDVPVLSRWAKGLMMIQSSVSLTILAVIAARAVNVL